MNAESGGGADRSAPISDNPCAAVGRAIAKARQLLLSGDSRKALAVLEKLQQADIRGIHQGYPEYFQTLILCRKKMGIDTRNAENRLAELEMDWQRALERGWKLLAEGKADQSLAFFQRSLNANPCEAGTAGGENEAWRGMAEAYRRMGNQEAAENCRKQIK